MSNLLFLWMQEVTYVIWIQNTFSCIGPVRPNCFSGREKFNWCPVVSLGMGAIECLVWCETSSTSTIWTMNNTGNFRTMGWLWNNMKSFFLRSIVFKATIENKHQLKRRKNTTHNSIKRANHKRLFLLYFKTSNMSIWHACPHISTFSQNLKRKFGQTTRGKSKCLNSLLKWGHKTWQLGNYRNIKFILFHYIPTCWRFILFYYIPTWRRL